MKKKKQTCLTMRKRILYHVLIIVALTVIVLSAVNFLFLQNTSKETVLNNYSEINRLTGAYLDEAIVNSEKGINRMVFEDGFQNALLHYERDRGVEKQEVLQYEVREYLASSLIVSDLYSGIISNVIVFDTDGKYIASMREYNEEADISQEDFIDRAREQKGKSVWMDTHRDPYDINQQYADVISVVKMLYSVKLSSNNPYYGKCIGYVLVNIKEQDFAKLFLDMAYGDTGKLYMINSDYVIISAAEKEKIGKEVDSRFLGGKDSAEFQGVDGKKYVLSSSFNPSTGWTLIGSVEAAELMTAVQGQWMNIAIIAIAIFSLLICIMAYTSKRITQPLADLQEGMKKVEQGEFTFEMEADYNIVEINDLVNGFQIMVGKLDELVENVYASAKREQQLQLLVVEARLRILQNQMNPHFLYNTLDSISWMASLSGQNGISLMVNSLGDILRASVKMDTFVSKVETELELLNKYIYIQKIRHGEKLDIVIDVEQGVLQCQILKFMLQPFVENAIVHGMKESGEQIYIQVKIGRMEEYLLSEIEDNGRGMSTFMKEQLFEEKEIKGKSTGTGCVNVYHRLQLIYKENFTCEVESEEEIGTKITIKIPLQEAYHLEH